MFFAQDMSEARPLGLVFGRERMAVGPLHDLPMSFKDQFHICDVETTIGYIGWIGAFKGVKGTGKEGIVEEGEEKVFKVWEIGSVKECWRHSVTSQGSYTSCQCLSRMCL
jgi:amidase